MTSSSCSSSAKRSSLSANWRLVIVLHSVVTVQASRNIQYSNRTPIVSNIIIHVISFSRTLTSSGKSLKFKFLKSCYKF